MESDSPEIPKKGKSKTPRKPKDSVLKQSLFSLSFYARVCVGRLLSLIVCSFFSCLTFGLCFEFYAESPAEFFADNKNIAGFDNVSFLHAYYLSVFLMIQITISNSLVQS